MKKLLVLVAVAALFSTSALAAIQNTKHDLSSTSTSGGIKGTATEICVYCHTPHGAVNATTAPLWNRTTTNATGFYNNPAGSMNATGITSTTVNATDAILCLTCHDGSSLTDPLNNPANSGGNVPTGQVGANSNLGLDLSNDHPIGFAFATAVADTGLYGKVAIEAKTGMTGALSYGTGDMMWCSSCHDVHGAGTAPYFLRVNNAGSALCLNCHNK